VRLVVEVLSPSPARHDRGMKWEDYAKAGIPNYWIVDHVTQMMTVFRLDGAKGQYVESATVTPGEAWKTDEPFPLTLDLAEVF